jgi:hypothetical protein
MIFWMRTIGNEVNDSRLRRWWVNSVDLGSTDVSLVLHFGAALWCCTASVCSRFTASEAATHFTLWCTGQRVVLGGLANAVFLAAVVTDRVNKGSYGHRYRPEDGDDEKNACLILGEDATPLAVTSTEGRPVTKMPIATPVSSVR